MKKILALLLAVCMMAGLVACGGTTTETTTETTETTETATTETAETTGEAGGTFKLGGTGPLTGGAAIYGNAVKNAAEIAVEEINAEGGAIQFELRYEDDQHDAEKAVNAYNTLKDWGMQISMGSVTSKPCEATSTETFADRIFALTPSASSTATIEGKDNQFQMCFTDPNQGTASAQYISTKGLGEKIAIIYNNADAYSTGIYQKFKDEADALNLDIVSTTTFTDDQTDFSVQVGDAKSAGADLLFLPIYYTPASLILSEAKKQDFAPTFFGVDGMDGILTLEGFDTELAEGVMLLTPFVATAEDDATQAFNEAYKAAAGSNENPNQFAADAYDCVKAIAQAIQAAGITPDMATDAICDALATQFVDASFAYEGLTGESSWSETGEVTKTPKGMVIENGVYMPLDEE